MKYQQRALRTGAVLILIAVVLRVAAGCGIEPLKSFFGDPEVAALMITMETGRLVSLPQIMQQATTPTDAEQTQPLPAALCFSEKDAAALKFHNYSGLRVDMPTLLCQSLSWNLQQPEPSVLILHTHTTESYTKNGQNYKETAQYRTLNTD